MFTYMYAVVNIMKVDCQYVTFYRGVILMGIALQYWTCTTGSFFSGNHESVMSPVLLMYYGDIVMEQKPKQESALKFNWRRNFVSYAIDSARDQTHDLLALLQKCKTFWLCCRNVKNIQKLNQRELELGVIGKKSWHDEYKDSAWVFIGGLPYDLTEGDIVCVFSQYECFLFPYNSFTFRPMVNDYCQNWNL